MENEINIVMGSIGEYLDARITIGETVYEIHEKVDVKKKFTFNYVAEKGHHAVRVQIDKISGYTPCVYTIEVT